MSRSSIDIPVVSKFDPTGIKQAQSALGGFSKSLIGIGTLVAGAFAIRAIGNFAAETVRMAEEVQQSEAVLRQVAKTTGVFGSEVDSVTKRLIAFANAQELRIGVDSEVIKVVQAQLLSFKALSASAGQAGGTFDRATKAAFDMAMVLKKDASAQAIALGKALENPIKGVTALARGGTTFTDQQREQIRTLVESNRLLDAQALILTEVESQYGGAAEAGALYSDRFRLGLEQIKETIGIALIPTFERFVEFFISDVVPPLTKFFEQDFPVLLQKLKPVAEDVMQFFSDIGQGLKDFLDIDADTSLLEGILDKFNEIGENPEFQTFLGNVKTIFDEMAPVLANVVFNMGELAVKLTPLLEGALNRVIPLLSDTSRIFSGIDYFLNEIISHFGEFGDETPSFIGWIEEQLNPLLRLQKLVKGIADAFDAAIAAYKRFKALGGFEGNGVITPPGAQVGGRANGGRVTGGMPYLVGEMGPELFMPGRGGNVVPNDRLGGGGGVVYNINVTAGMGTNGAQVGEQIVNAIKRYERVSGPVFASA
jgi:hypothetical protein